MVIYDAVIGLLSNAFYDSIVSVMHGDPSSNAYNKALKELNKKYKLSKTKIDTFLQQEDAKEAIKKYIENKNNYEPLKNLTDEFLASFGKENFSREYANSILSTFFEKVDIEIENDPELRAYLQLYLTKQTYVTVQETNQEVNGLSLGVQELSLGIQKLDKKLDLINGNRTNHKEILIHYNPSTLPLYPEKLKQFVTENRADELRNALAYLEKHRILLLSGVGGVGKTTLARALVDFRPINVPEPFWLSFYDNQDAKLGDILEKLAIYMNAHELAAFKAGERKPGKFDVDKLTDELERRGQLWLIFDDLNIILEGQQFSDKGIELLFSSLQSNIHSAKIIITSRILPTFGNGESLIDVIEEEKKHHLYGLSENYAIDYLAKNGLDNVEPYKLGELARGVDGHPLALKLLINLVTEFGVADTLGNLNIFKEQKAETILKAKKLFDKLVGDEKELLERVSVYRGLVSMKGLEIMFTEKMSSNSVKNLIDKSLLETDHCGNYWLHPLVQEFSYDNLKNKKEVHLIAYNYYSSLPIPEKPIKKEEFLPAIEAHYHACEAEEYDLAAQMIYSSKLYNYLITWGDYTTLITLCRRLLPDDPIKDTILLNSTMKRIGDQNLECRVLGDLGLAYRFLGKPKKAIEYHKQALEISKLMKDASTEGNQLESLGIAYIYLSEHRRAIKCFQKALKIAEYIENRELEGKVLDNLGLAYRYLGETRKVIEYCEQALKIARENGDHRVEGNSLINQGVAYLYLGEPGKSFECLVQALKIYREIGYKRGEGSALGNLGLAYSYLSEPIKAIEYCEQALKIAEEIGDRRREGNNLENIGAAYIHLGKPTKAIEYCKKALKITKEIGYRLGEGEILGYMGLAYSCEGKLEKAIEHYEQALRIAREIGYKRGEGSVLGRMGSVYYLLDEPIKANEFLKEALAIGREIEDPRIISFCEEKLEEISLTTNSKK